MHLNGRARREFRSSGSDGRSWPEPNLSTRFPAEVGPALSPVHALSLDGSLGPAAEGVLAELEPFETEAIEQALRSLPESLELKPRQVFQSIRIAVTGTNVSPSLFESIELLGREQTLERLRSAAAIAGD